MPNKLTINTDTCGNLYVNGKYIGAYDDIYYYSVSKLDKRYQDKSSDYYTRPVPKRILQNGPATIVFWKDGSKTIVKRKKGEKNDPYVAFCAAVVKKIYGTNSHVKHLIELTTDEVY